jgi:hypothetical protein
VRLVVSAVGGRRTRLKIIDSSEGKCPDIEAELQQWVIEKLGGTYYRPV